MKKCILIYYLTVLLLLLSSCNNVKSTNKTENKEIDQFLILVNKDHPLHNNYIPTNLINVHTVDYIKRENEVMKLNEEALNNYILLYEESLKYNLKLTIFSSYRSFEKQTILWNNNPNENYVAKPGYSEHQTGLALDISRRDVGLETNFMYTAEYNFLINNAHNYGFINRYPLDKEIITGYLFEPWHFRYVGVENAKNIYYNNLTLEEYLA